MTENPGFIARGNISPSVFCTKDGTPFGVVQSTTGDLPIGIAQLGTHDPPGVTGSSAFAAASGQQLQVFTNADFCMVAVGSAFTAGDKLGPNASGQAISVVVGQFYGAIALESATGTAGELRRVKVQPGKY